MADHHYTFRPGGKRMSHEVGPPGQKIVFLTSDDKAVWGSHRPAPWAGIVRSDRLEGLFCFLFRNEGYPHAPSSILTQEAVGLTALRWGLDDFWTYVAKEHVQSSNPGYCYLEAGFKHNGWVESTKLGVLRRLVMVKTDVERLATQHMREMQC